MEVALYQNSNFSELTLESTPVYLNWVQVITENTHRCNNPWTLVLDLVCCLRRWYGIGCVEA